MAGDRFGGIGGTDGDDDIEFIDDDYLDDDDEFVYDEDEYETLGFEEVAAAIGLPDELPAVRLPPEAELAAQARSAALPARLAALVRWVGADGRSTDEAGDLSPADAAEAARAAGGDEAELAFLWEYALAGDWLDFDDDDDELDEDDLEVEAHVSPSGTAEDWASGRDDRVLSAWRKTLAGVLTSTFDVMADSSPESAAGLDFRGQGIAMALMLFLARAEGLPLADISEAIVDTATAELEPGDASRASEAWLSAHGAMAARPIIGMLAELGAVIPPYGAEETVRLTPLALWALREELEDTGITVPLLPSAVADMTAAQLLQVAGDTDQAEFESESDAWVATRDPDQAARELLRVAADEGPGSRVLAVSVVSRIGDQAEPAWRESLDTPELRPYAKITLASLAGSPGRDIPAGLEPVPEDMAWVATDMLALACDDEDPDPEVIAECLTDSVPQGEEAMLFDLIARAAHPDAMSVLSHIGRHHPDKRIAKDARTAAHRAESRRGSSPQPPPG